MVKNELADIRRQIPDTKAKQKNLRKNLIKW